MLGIFETYRVYGVFNIVVKVDADSKKKLEITLRNIGRLHHILSIKKFIIKGKEPDAILYGHYPLNTSDPSSAGIKYEAEAIQTLTECTANRLLGPNDRDRILDHQEMKKVKH